MKHDLGDKLASPLLPPPHHKHPHGPYEDCASKAATEQCSNAINETEAPVVHALTIPIWPGRARPGPLQDQQGYGSTCC